MPFQTLVHGGVTCQRRQDDLRVIIQGSNDRMLVQKAERLLLGGLTPQQLPEWPQVEGTVGKCDFTGFFQLRAGVARGETQQPLQDARAFDATGV